ncbi:TetR/AcrR family transcriptional regulator [Hymenobacter metallilatus]|uniref:TetR/AcrR family transcriptional regulator n=1 Tax=Hymenobacter metallilatus TaxID=2493666 RepID=A0A428JU74_9BACT|nr:TetR/AcrR family transcriptional regulator [Hymenobacter metallilatus]RSK37550.1 TetR/AcrR family transcriptional regulator [Hymenobacter metallilatus]
MSKATDRRAVILDAAAGCFARYGYAKTTLDDIGRAVQLNKASLYYYFPNKDELFMAVVLRESAAFMQALAERVQHLPTPTEQVREYLLERLRYYRHVLDQHQLSVAALQVLEPRFEALYAEVLGQEIAFLAGLLHPLLAAAAAPEPRHLARLLLSAADALKHAAVRQAAPTPLSQPDFTAAEADTRLLTDLVLAGLAQR